MLARDEDGKYWALGASLTEQDVLTEAEEILRRRCLRGESLTSPDHTRRYLVHRLSTKEREVFGCIFLDNRHRVLAYEDLFFGTIDSASVHPREVIKRALTHNAAALILAHNHPSGVAEPSGADKLITKRLKSALELIDVRVLDHIVVGGTEAVSMAERGLV